MATMIVYADEYTAGASFYLVSRWESDGSRFTSSPSLGAISQYFTQNIPTGATFKNATLFARVGERWWPVTGMQAGYPKANSETMTVVDASTDQYLYSVPVTFSDLSVSTQVTITFKANGNKLNSGRHMASLSFDDVYQLVEYEPPCSAWTITSEDWEHTLDGRISGEIITTEYNKEYSHQLTLKLNDTTIEQIIRPIGSSSSADHVSWAILIEGDIGLSLMKSIPKTMSSAIATLTLDTISNDTVLGSETKEVKISIPSDARPDAGFVMFRLINSVTNSDGETLALQNYSSAEIWAEGAQGDYYGSTIEKMYIECTNGKTYELKKCYKDSSSVVLNADIKGRTYVAKTESIVTEIFQTPGNYPVYVYVIDSRGNKDWRPYDDEAQFFPAIYVTAYSPIVILGSAQGRLGDCPTNNQLDAWYAKIAFEYSEYSSDSDCSLSLLLTASDGTETIIDAGTYTSNQKFIVESPEAYCLNKDLSYKITYRISDGQTTASITRLLGSSYAFMRWEPNKNAIGFGCYPAGSNSNCVEIAADWDLILNGGMKLLDSSTGEYLSLKEYILNIITETISNSI